MVIRSLLAYMILSPYDTIFPLYYMICKIMNKNLWNKCKTRSDNSNYRTKHCMDS